MMPHLHRDVRSPLPHLHTDCACCCHICTGTALTPATSAPGFGRRSRSCYCRRACPSVSARGHASEPARVSIRACARVRVGRRLGTGGGGREWGSQGERGTGRRTGSACLSSDGYGYRRTEINELLAASCTPTGATKQTNKQTNKQTTVHQAVRVTGAIGWSSAANTLVRAAAFACACVRAVFVRATSVRAYLRACVALWRGGT